MFDEVVAPTRLAFTFTFVDANDRPTVNAMMPEWPVGAHIVMTVELVATARGTRMTVAQRVASGTGTVNPAENGSLTFRLANSWTYNAASYTQTLVFTLTAP